jgi:hypothetical protein
MALSHYSAINNNSQEQCYIIVFILGNPNRVCDKAPISRCRGAALWAIYWYGG